ncbi:zinc transporter ZupT [Porphyromonas gingivicanis]|uniref:Zinc transporter ZupT n=1 Tax=Porphyromonas gingivicanis TaxID=266762 RepID=A0A0A2G2I8_9PORP|nr:zinc transporter ZupT [Porphyromonas gingivicanis]KGN97488.1 zinc transporter ZupT [Porphyromonas gingivicanis]
MDQQVLFAFLLTLFAGISTGIGSIIAFFSKRTNTSFLCISLGFSAGVMIYVSFVEMFPESLAMFSRIYSPRLAATYTALSFFGGIFLIALIDKLIPQKENPHEMHDVEELAHPSQTASMGKNKERKLLRVGLFTALILVIHNFPEGMVTFLSGMQDIRIAIPIAFAIAIHNIPEGISVSVPIFYATGNRKKAFWLSFLSGLAEPLGALFGYLILAPYLNDTIYGIIFAAIAGIMVYISLDELLPAAEEYGLHHQAIYGVISGMLVMAISLLIL